MFLRREFPPAGKIYKNSEKDADQVGGERVLAGDGWIRLERMIASRIRIAANLPGTSIDRKES